MEKIKKAFSLTVMVIFLSQNAGFCISEKSSALRPPSHFNSAIERFLREQSNEVVTIPVDANEKAFALEGNMSYQDFIDIMSKGRGQIFKPQIYDIVDIGNLLGKAQVQRSLLKEDDKPLMALNALLSKAITLVTPDPKVFYAGIGIGTRSSVFDIRFPLFATDFKELIGTEMQWIDFSRFKELVIQQLDNLVTPQSIQFNKIGESNEQSGGIYEARFTVLGKERLIRGYYGKRYKLPEFIPNEIKEHFNVLIDRTGSSSRNNELKIKFLELLDKDAGFILDWSLRQPTPHPNINFIIQQQIGFDFGELTDKNSGSFHLSRLLSEDLYIHNITCLKRRKINHMLHLLVFPETANRLKKSKSETNLATEYFLDRAGANCL
jgi:hypothetical protein